MPLTQRRYARVVLAVLFGVGMIGALGVSGLRPDPDPLLVPHQSETWGAEHVVAPKSHAVSPLFPSKRRWGAHAAVMRGERAPRHNAPIGDWSR